MIRKNEQELKGLNEETEELDYLIQTDTEFNEMDGKTDQDEI